MASASPINFRGCQGEAMKTHRARRVVYVALVSLAALCLLPPAGSRMAAQGKGTIKIATQSPLSGGQAALGEGIKLGAQLALERFKGPLEKMGFAVELVPFDDQAKPDVGVANAKNLIADPNVLAVIGHLNSGVAIPASEVYKDASLAMISPANTNPTVTDRGYPNVFRVCGRDDVQGAVGAEFAKSLGVKTAYVIHDKTTYGQGVAEFFKAEAEKKGIKVLGFEGSEERSNFDPIITPVKARNPELIYFGGLYDQAGPFFGQAREKGAKSRFMGPDGLDSSDLAKIAGKAVVGMYYTSVAGPVSVYPQARQFAEEYRKKFGKNPEPFAAQAYDATAIALRGIAAAAKGGRHPDREAVAAAIRAVKYTGITGTIEFDGKGDPKKALYFVLQVTSDNPEKWGENREVKRLLIASPTPKM
ncbi:MAG: branched-chain amino acid ABC transporter substrate-binding protein [Candidatus Rokuibacteriota bacterium]|nr:MAG: branched-chain amino acid ABC transporter substrate-binding protein [Candidatus Rokubacteria bacterium]